MQLGESILSGNILFAQICLSYYYLKDPEHFLEYLVPKADDEDNNNEEYESDYDHNGRRPGEEVSVWSISGQTYLAGKGFSGRNPSLEEATPKLCHMLKRKEDEATAVDDQKVKVLSDCKKYGGEAKRICALADANVHEAQLQRNDNVETDYENNSIEAPNKLWIQKHVENAEYEIEKLVEFYAEEATQQTQDYDDGDVKNVILASNMDVRVIVTNIVEEMEDQLVGRKAGEQQEQGKRTEAESVALDESQTLLEDSMTMERSVNQEEIEFIKKLLQQLDR